MPPPPTDPVTVSSACPGCGVVLVSGGRPERPHPGAAPSCARLFEVTLHGLREESTAAATAAATVRLADDAYDAQHPSAGDPDRLRTALRRLGLPDDPPPPPPSAWQMTIGDVAADLDVIDLPVLIDSWARAVVADWVADGAADRAAGWGADRPADSPAPPGSRN